ncbi:MAG: ferrous iron transport protein B [Planctomycetota bacterium]
MSDLRDARAIRLALAGNPNAGKTTIFNAITGARQHVGNYPGVTVERKQGNARIDGVDLHIEDLPGTYSLDAHSPEEIVAQRMLLDEPPDVVIDIVDASNLERNLYLTTQLLELGLPVVLAMNMSDVAAASGVEMDVQELSALLGVPIVQTVGHRGEGVDELLRTAVTVARNREQAVADQRHCTYGNEIEQHLQPLTRDVTAACGEAMPARWTALKLIEGQDSDALKHFHDACTPEQAEVIRAEAEHVGKHLAGVFGEAADVILAERRFGYISGAVSESVRSNVHRRHELSDKLDAVLTHRWLGLPVFAVLMYAVFHLTFTAAEAPMHWLEMGFEWLGGTLATFWPKGSDSLLKSLVVDGIIGGVGGVLVFLPNILFLFLAIALLEDTGYMARAAFIIDHVMHKLGLHGKSFIPMLIGFGCSVPAILATRTLETRRDRLTTMLVVPLMSCGARFPIYALIIPAFFPPAWRAPMLWGIYMIGIALAIVLAKVLRSTILKGETTPFVMELPPYRMPTTKGLLIHTWERAWMYVRKAGTILLAASILLWAVGTFPRKQDFSRDYDELANQARRRYVAQADQLAVRLDLPDANAPVTLAGARMEWQEQQREYWPHEDGWQQAKERFQQTKQAALRRPGGDRLATMLTVAERIGEIKDGFEELVREHEWDEDDPAYKLAADRRDTKLAALKQEYPDAYPAAMFYRRDMRAPLKERLAELAGQRGSELASYALAGRIGQGLEPVIRPLGFDWKLGTAMIGALAAKEIFVAQLGIVYSVADEDEGSAADSLRGKLRKNYTALQAFCVMLFCLTSAPCVATIAATRQESGRWSWALLQLGGLTALAYISTLIVYQVGRLLV